VARLVLAPSVAMREGTPGRESRGFEHPNISAFGVSAFFSGHSPHAARSACRSAVSVSLSSAVAVAAALSDEFKALKGLRHVGVILSGGNVDLDHLPW